MTHYIHKDPEARTRPMRHNCHNEVLQLRALLKLAYNALRENKCLIPRELMLWIRAQKEIPIAERMSADLTVEKANDLVRSGSTDGL